MSSASSLAITSNSNLIWANGNYLHFFLNYKYSLLILSFRTKCVWHVLIPPPFSLSTDPLKLTSFVKPRTTPLSSHQSWKFLLRASLPGLLTLGTLDQWFSDYGPWTRSISLTRELVGKANSRLHWIRNWRTGVRVEGKWHRWLLTTNLSLD